MIKKLISHKIAEHTPALIGVVFVIGSTGLFLGGVACAIASALINTKGMELTYAMMIGFFATWFIFLVLGLLLILLNTKKK